jgi:hypothetical protein
MRKHLSPEKILHTLFQWDPLMVAEFRIRLGIIVLADANFSSLVRSESPFMTADFTEAVSFRSDFQTTDFKSFSNNRLSLTREPGMESNISTLLGLIRFGETPACTRH